MKKKQGEIKSKRDLFKEKITPLARPFLMHEKPFEDTGYQSFYDMYRKYIEKEPAAEYENIISRLAGYQEKIFTNEPVTDKLILDLVDKYEAEYEKDSMDTEIGLPDSLHRIKKKKLRLLISRYITEYFKGFKYDHNPYLKDDSRSIVFTKEEGNCKLAIDFDMGAYGAGVWVKISIGVLKPSLLLINLARYMSYDMISYNNLSEADKKLENIFVLLDKIAMPFFNAIRDASAELIE